MTWEERPITFTCEGDTLVGIVTQPSTVSDLGLLIVVGGPQYRVGSHRQFVLLARAVAGAGFAAMRFDHRGVGDASGVRRSFDGVTADIQAAIDAFRTAVPALQRIAIFGLCDAASAALIAAPSLTNLAGLILANPWVRTPQTQNATIVRHYYVERLRSGRFWWDVLRRPSRIVPATVEFLRRRKQAAASGTLAGGPDSGYITRMLHGWSRCIVDRLLLLSGRDLTALEFSDLVSADRAWATVPAGVRSFVRRIDDADHTFSDPIHRAEVEAACVAFLREQCHPPNNTSSNGGMNSAIRSNSRWGDAAG
jgi:exosortase A-associated hydrolase 1